MEEKEVENKSMAESWYETEGKTCIHRMLLNLMAKGYQELYIRRDGVCAVYVMSKFQYAGKIPEMPFGGLQVLKACLSKEAGITVVCNSCFAKITWKEADKDVDSQSSAKSIF